MPLKCARRVLIAHLERQTDQVAESALARARATSCPPVCLERPRCAVHPDDSILRFLEDPPPAANDAEPGLETYTVND